jgi:hypothetical protein
MNERRFRDLIAELIDENPFAIRAVLRILRVEFTSKVATLAVTCEERPRLLVNLDFVRAHCRTDDEAKALLCHEFLHVLLRHTETRKPLTPARHLAFDAVINAIIHRQHGETYSALMSRYYAGEPGLGRLLRPMNAPELAAYTSEFGRKCRWPDWVRAWSALYEGRLVADDIEALARDLRGRQLGTCATPGSPFEIVNGSVNIDRLLGDHDGLDGRLPDSLVKALDQTLKTMNGGGVWRTPKDRGVGSTAYSTLVTAADEALHHWQRRTLELLLEHLLPDPRSRAIRDVPQAYRIPVLSPGDRRAFLRAQWSPFLPEACWQGTMPRCEGTAQVYLDVSGSMNAEMPLVIALLARLSNWIRRPLWAFSNTVVPALIESGQLKTSTTGGTSMTCVLEHVAKTRPAAAIVLTDGYIEQLGQTAVRRALAATRFTALLTRDGNPAQLHRAGIPYRQLDRVPR